MPNTNKRAVTLPDAYCPICNEHMEAMQLTLMESPLDPTKIVWHEVWTCDSCRTNHVFPARLAFLEFLGIDSHKPNANDMAKTFDMHPRVIHLPRGVKA